jgi:hypothetical protein
MGGPLFASSLFAFPARPRRVPISCGVWGGRDAKSANAKKVSSRIVSGEWLKHGRNMAGFA